METNGTLVKQLAQVIDEIDIISMDMKLPSDIGKAYWQEHEEFLKLASKKDVYVKIVITDKGVTLPKGSVATVEFNGMGGSKSLEVYPPSQESLAINKLIVVQPPTRLNDAMGLLSEMFDKIGSITTRMSVFAKETGMDEGDTGINLDEIQSNMNIFDTMMKEVSDIKNKGVENEQRKSENNQ